MDVKMTRREALRTFGVGSAALALAACAPKAAEQPTAAPQPTSVPAEAPQATVVPSTAAQPASEAPVEISFEHFFNAPELWPTFERIFALIEEQQGVKINSITVPYDEMQTKLLTLIAGGTPPDMTSLPSDYTAEVASKDVLLPLDDLMNSDPPCPKEDIMAARLADSSWNGKLYGMPIDQGSDAICYNTTIFDAAGIEYPTKEWTWDDLLEKALVLTVDKNGNNANSASFDPAQIEQWGFQYNTSFHRMHTIWTSLSGEEMWFSDDLSTCLMDDPAIVDGLQYLIDLRCQYHVAPTADQLSAVQNAAAGIQPFGLGRYAMEFTWVGITSALNLEGVAIGNNYDVVAPPRGKKSVATSGGQAFPITKDSKNQDAAWKAIKMFLTEDVMKMLGQEGAWLPARISLAKYGQPLDGYPQHYIEAYVDPVAEYGFSKPWYVPGWTEVQQEMTTALEPCWLCQSNAKDAIASFVGDVPSLFKKS